jgi:8-oxo-dGTP pyrophosphatase MutT (NUDIX family)
VNNELLPPWARSLPKHFTASGFVIQDGRILLVNHRKHGVWIYPGGHVEPDETTDEACLREVLEETGIHCRIVSPRDESLGEPEVVEVLHIPWMVLCERIPAGNDQPEHCHIDYAYVCEPLPGESGLLAQDARETNGIGWFSLAELTSLELFPDFRRQTAKLLTDYPVWNVSAGNSCQR